MSRISMLSAAAVAVLAMSGCADQSADAGMENDGIEPPVAAGNGNDDTGYGGANGDDLANGCNADAASSALGQEASADVVEQARQDAGAQLVRTIAPDQVITMEYHNSRLNLKVDEANVVTSVTCG